MASFKGTSGPDNLTGTPQDDSFDLSQGGSDRADGLAGDDVFKMGAALDPYDVLHGGSGTDVVQLDGNYAHLVLRANSFSSINQIEFAGGHDYYLKTNNGNVAKGAVLTVDASRLEPGDKLTFNGSAEQDGSFIFVGGGEDHFIGGQKPDIFKLGGTLDSSDRIDGGGASDHLVLDGNYSGDRALQLKKNSVKSVAIFAVRSGHDYDIAADNGAFGSAHELINVVSYTFGPHDSLRFDGSAEKLLPFRFFPNQGTYDLSGGSANDSFCFGKHFNTSDIVNGGGGNDTLVLNGSFQHADLNGDYTGANRLKFGANQLNSIETIALVGQYNYNLTTSDRNVKAGHTLTIKTTGFKTSGTASKSGDLPSLSTENSFHFDGKAETDGHFVFDIAGAHDWIRGGAQSDTFSYLGKPHSDGATYDIIDHFNFSNDRLQTKAVSGIDPAVKHGALSKGGFDHDLQAALGAAQLDPHHAALFRPSSGGLAGHWFLVVDENGKAGYQSNADLVVQLNHPLHIADLGSDNFVR